MGPMGPIGPMGRIPEMNALALSRKEKNAPRCPG